MFGIPNWQVSPSVSGSVLTLCAPGMMAVTVDLARMRGKGFRAAVWGQAVPACDCGEEAARWLSRFLLQEDAGLRLVYYPLEKPAREVRAKNKPFPLAVTLDTVSSFLLFIFFPFFPPFRLLQGSSYITYFRSFVSLQSLL